MLIAGETSGDLLAAELVSSLRTKVLEAESVPTDDLQPLRTELAPAFFGAGGPRMKKAGVELAFDLTQHSVIGVSDVLKNIVKFRRLFRQLVQLAIQRQPDVIIGVDYGGFNLRFGHAIKQYVSKHRSEFVPWNPKIVQYVSPQVWASRPGRAYLLGRDYDLLLSIFPFEKEWYAARVPKLRVEFVGHPMIERMQNAKCKMQNAKTIPVVLLLPGSRKSELNRHLPVMMEAAKLIHKEKPMVRFKMVLPSEELKQFLTDASTPATGVEVQVGELTAALAEAAAAVASTGTVTLECAYFGVPTVAIYKTSWSTYLIARQIVTVKHLAMPNLLGNETIYPELIQSAATGENIAREALELLNMPERRRIVRTKLAQVIGLLGASGASQRAAEAVLSLIR